MYELTNELVSQKQALSVRWSSIPTERMNQKAFWGPTFGDKDVTHKQLCESYWRNVQCTCVTLLQSMILYVNKYSIPLVPDQRPFILTNTMLLPNFCRFILTNTTLFAIYFAYNMFFSVSLLTSLHQVSAEKVYSCKTAAFHLLFCAVNVLLHAIHLITNAYETTGIKLLDINCLIKQNSLRAKH